MTADGQLPNTCVWYAEHIGSLWKMSHHKVRCYYVVMSDLRRIFYLIGVVLVVAGVGLLGYIGFTIFQIRFASSPENARPGGMTATVNPVERG